jgi:hypothetical protein
VRGIWDNIYEDGTLKRILVDGGYIENGVYYYYLTDHLGNNRIVANASGTVVQKNHYYPFGMPFLMLRVRMPSHTSITTKSWIHGMG